jgi:glycosyltransferase involved in cell wall biosynthesis
VKYCRDVQANGLETCRHWPYAFGRFDDGSPIPDAVREYYRSHPHALQRASGDPFRIGWHAFLNEPWGQRKAPLVTKLVRWLWEKCKNLQAGFPDADGRFRHHLAQHFVSHTARELKIPEFFVAPMRESIGRYNRRPVRRAARLLKGLARRTLAWLRPAQAADPNVQDSAFSVRQLHAPTVGRTEPFHWTDPNKDGLNIIGYVRSEHGLGESARLCSRACEAAALPCSLHDFNANNNSRIADVSWAHKIAPDNLHPVNLFHINADQLPVARALLGADFFAGRFNIGFWHWELPEFPEAWRGAFDLLDEVWVPTQFVRSAVAAKSPLPVMVMPHAIRCDVNPVLTRAGLGLPKAHFLFLTMYDTHSFQERKNPQAAIDAFRKAFPNPREVSLVVKINNPASAPQEVRDLKARLAGVPGVIVLDRIFSRQEVYSLEGFCDAFVSLHRSEGFGLGLAESMWLGKPVVGTSWSGNVDFMNADNSCPVDYRLVRLEQDYGPYPRGQEWADPDLDHAAWYLAKLVADAGWRQAIAARGRDTIRSQFSPEVVGAMYRRRLEEIRRTGSGGHIPQAA